MEHLEKLKDTLCEELEMYAKKKNLSPSELGVVHMLTDTVKNIDKILMYEEYDEGGGYSRDGDGYSRARYSRESGESMRGYSRDGSERSRYNDGGNSYANRGEHYVHGHYSRDEGRDGGRYSREEGKENMSDQLRDMMDGARTEKEREIIRRAISQLDNA